MGQEERFSLGQEMWTSLSLAPRRRYRDLIEHKIWAVNGEHQTHALALGRGWRRPDWPLWTSAFSGRVHSSYCLYPAARRLVLSERECFFPSTVRVLRLGEENEIHQFAWPTRAWRSSDFANILQWQADRRKTHRDPTSFYLIRSRRIGYRIKNPTLYSKSYCAQFRAFWS